jgi:hypothetical protein
MKLSLGQRYGLLAAILVVATIACGGVLPAIGRLPSVAGWIERNESRGIDPSARYYTDHPACDRLLERLEEARTAHPDAFYSASKSSRIGCQ